MTIAPNDATKWSALRVRTIFTVAMIVSFFAIVGAGPFYSSALVTLICSLSYSEISQLNRKLMLSEDTKTHHSTIRLAKVQVWYWYVFCTGIAINSYICRLIDTHLGYRHDLVSLFLARRNFIAYIGFLVGVMLFIVTIRKDTLKQQFSFFIMTLVTGATVLIQGMNQIRIINVGLIWFFLSTTAVICNDIAAYLCGVAWGKTPLLPRVSPKKTVEGFIGAAFVTVFWTLGLFELLVRSKVMTCPNGSQTMIPFDVWTQTDCVIDPRYNFVPVELPSFLPTIYVRPMWMHVIVIGLFASLFAPFGGFVASVYKRSFNVKDFGNSIPGHGGITDRFDCQLIMGALTWYYLHAYLVPSSFNGIVDKLQLLSLEEKKELFIKIGEMIGVM